jgi:uncharacterized membrane protein YdjX (TVP38/TMEM64 family)
MTKRKIILLDAITIIGLILTAAFIIYGFHSKIFVSPKALQDFLKHFGIFADIIFILVQAVQVVIPIIPGALGCLAGVIIFGPIKGFIYNYIGICMGSMIAFFLARRYGMAFVEKITNPKLLQKYHSWLNNEKFDKWFALAIFMPIAPDDFLCYLAGITKISGKKFSMIILAGKPFGIAAYSMGLNLIFTAIVHYVMPIVR